MMRSPRGQYEVGEGLVGAAQRYRRRPGVLKTALGSMHRLDPPASSSSSGFMLPVLLDSCP
jgi:hypothetical protein